MTPYEFTISFFVFPIQFNNSKLICAEESDLGTICFALGFIIMMILDVALGFATVNANADTVRNKRNALFRYGAVAPVF